MIIFGTEEQSRRHRRAVRMPDGVESFKAEWMESGKDQDFSPTVFLVEQPPNYTVATHFHRHNEYQVVVQGSGKLARHDLRPVTVHYAGAYTGYGPLVSGAEGLFYFTLRPAFDPGPLYAVEHRDQMLRGPKRQLHGAPFSPASVIELRALQTVEEREIFPLAADLGAARVLRLPPNATAPGLAPTGSAGQFLMVIAGSTIHAGRPLNRWETLFLSNDEPALLVAAGDSGAEVLLLQVPRMADEYVTRRQTLSATP